MARGPEEIDYLASTKAPAGTFAASVREAFALEHRCLWDEDIATKLGVTPGRMSQILNGPRALKAETVQKIIAALDSRIHKRTILKVWQAECFGEDLSHADGVSFPAGIEETTLLLIDKLIRESRPDRALKLTREALTHPLEGELKQRLLDRAYYLQLRLDKVGEAMQTAELLYTWGSEEQSLPKMAGALAMRARILRSIGGVPAETMRRVQQQALAVVEAMPMSARTPNKHILPTAEGLRVEEIALVIREHDEHGGASDYLKDALRFVEARVGAAEGATKKATALHVKARLHLALGDYFQAEEVLDESFKAGKKTLAKSPKAGILKAKILTKRGDIEGAIAYFEKLATICEQERSLYHLRLVEYDLAVLRSYKFPPSHPV